MATPSLQFDGPEPTELLTIEEVEVRTKMRHSWIYELIKRGEFPAPIRLGGSKWIAAEVDEYIRRKEEERDRQRGENKFVPRARVLPFSPARPQDTSPSVAGVINSAVANESSLRVLSPEMCDALRTLRINIPELYLDSNSWQVNLLIMKVNLNPTPATAENLKRGKKR